MWNQRHNTFEQVRDMLIAVRDLNSEKIELMLQAHRKYWNRGVALEFTDEEVATVPKEMYMAVMYREVEWLWNRLPIKYREDVHFQKYRRCAEDHNNPGTVEISANAQKICVMCMRESVEALTQHLLSRHAL